MNDRDAAERDRLLSQAMTQVARDQAAIREMEARRRPKSRRGLLIGAIAAFSLVAAWNAWLLLRGPQVPTEEQQICGLMRTAGAVGEEVLGLRASTRRVPTAEELGYLLDGRLTYRTEGSGFAVMHTDGVHTVSYDGSQPVNAWMAAAGCPVQGSAP
jgi:hypothetical protein